MAQAIDVFTVTAADSTPGLPVAAPKAAPDAGGGGPENASSYGAWIGTMLAFVLLGIYAISTIYMLNAILTQCPGSSVTDGAELCAGYLKNQFPDGYIFVVTTVGGLVSALVIGVLGVTEPGQSPTNIGSDVQSALARSVIGFVISFYLVIWTGVGLACLIIGVMIHPGALSTVSDIGTNWLGLAVAAGYAYFGLSPAGANS